MKTFLHSCLFLLCFFSFWKADAQCPTASLGDQIFTSQVSINNFGATYAGCTDIILGKVVIGFDGGEASSDITDLSPLANVKTITGSLYIANNPNLLSLDGLNALTSIGVGLDVWSNANLKNINGFPALTSIGEYLYIQNNINLENINGFPALTSIGTYLAIQHNLVLTDISGLQNINPATITGGIGLYISNNPQLAVCHLSNFCEYLSGSGARTISGNKTTCLNEQAVITACACPVGNWGDKTFTTQAQINAFANAFASCNNITVNNLIIGYETGGTNSNITNLTPLAKIKTVTGNLIIRRNTTLTTLNGLQNITSFNGDLRIDSNHLLTDISALLGITEAKFLNIRNNNVLQNLNGLHNLTQLSDYLYIRANGMLTNLNPLQNLTSVGNYIEIYENPVLTDISGLQNIAHSSFSRLTITGNPQLAVCNLSNFCTYLSGSGNRDISGNKTFCMSVPAITATCSCTTEADFTLSTQAEVNDFGLVFAHCTDVSVNNLIIGYNEGGDNSDITDLSPLAKIKTLTGNLILRRNTNLTTLNGLQNITSFNGNLRIDSNFLLTDISALSGITQAKFLNIRNNNVLPNLNGLHNLTQLSNYLYIRANGMLTNLNPLQNLTSVGNYIEIYENPVLTNITGLRNIAPSSFSGLTITDNPELAVCNLSNFCTYLSGSGARTISGNKTTCLNVGAVTTACATACASVSGQNFTFNTQAQLNEFGALYGNCFDITLGNVVIGYGSGSNLSDITDLSPLANVKTITGYLAIRITNLPSLNGLNGFPALTSIGSYFNIFNNANLENINGFPALTSIGGYLYIMSNSNLENINGFSALTSIGTNLNIWDNAKLENINGFPFLTSIGTYLRIEKNSVLTDISGLENINPATITGAIGLEIKDNPQLEVCHLSNICSYLSGTGNRTINNNKTTCLNESAIITACASGCVTGSKTFTTQAQINAFATDYASCNNITVNNLIIGYNEGGDNSDITDLSPLAKIKTVTGNLIIRRNTTLTTLNGLQNITSFNGNLRIDSNFSLTDISALSGITQAKFLNIRNNNVLPNLNGLHNLTQLSNYLYIRANGMLTNLNPLQNLTSVGNYIEIYENPVLTNILGLRNIAHSSISGSGLIIKDNPELAVCNLSNFCTYLSGTGNRDISGNKTTCLNVGAVTTACASACASVSGQNITFNTQAQLDEFGALYGNCTDIILGEVLIIGADITDLSPLANVKHITGYLRIVYNTFTDLDGTLVGLDGFASLESIGGYLHISDNQLTDIIGFPALKNIGSYITIYNNAELENINGFPVLASIGMSLRIENNANLEKLNEFPVLASIGMWVTIQDNPNLEEINGFPALTSIGGSLYFHNNAKLEEINGFSDLTNIGGYLAFENNSVLTDISGLENIDPATITGIAGLYIKDNPQLAVCHLSNFCTYLSNPNKPRTISGNKTTCIDEQAVITACNPCPTTSLGNRTFTTQAQLDAFATDYGNCTDIILGDVIIGYATGSNLSDIHDLSPLANVKTITERLLIRNNPNLPHLNGTNGFPALTSIGSTLNIWNNAEIQQINGFPDLTSVGEHLLFDNNAKLENINGFPALASVGRGLQCYTNAKLKNINGFPALASIGDFFYMSANAKLEEINGFPVLESIGTNFTIQSNTNLENINGFPVLTSIGTFLRIQNNPNLEEINGFPDLTSIETYLSIFDNSGLQQINGFGSLTHLGHYLNITDNLALTEVNGFSGLTNIGESLVIQNNNLLTNLNGLSAVTTIAGSLDIRNNDALTNLNGLSSLTNINGYIAIADHDLLTDISGLANIETITGYLFIRNNQNLLSFDGLNGFPALTSVGGFLEIGNNLNLENINGFPALTSIGTYLTVQNNYNLEEINGFPALTSIGTYLDIAYNTKLENINGFPALTSIGAYLSIRSNPVLTDISGLENINSATITGTIGLRIVNNPELAVCNLPNICAYLSTSKPRTISGNKTTCIDEQAVLEACIPFGPDNNNILYVNSSVSGGNNKGNSWANAVPQLADALKWANEQHHTNPAVFDATPLKIYVAQGTYKPLYRADNLDGSNPQDRDNAFVMVKNVQLYGGFDPANGIVSLDDDRQLPSFGGVGGGSILNGDIDTVSGLSANDAYHVVISAGDVGSALLDGFTVSGGYIASANGNNITVNSTAVSYERGSGLSVSNSSPQIHNTVFTGNRAYAGAVSHTNSNATFVNTLFTGNTAQFGTVYNASSSPVFVNCTLSGNIGTDNANNGVAMRNVTSHPEFYNTIVWGNHTSNGNINNIFNSGGGNPTSIPVYHYSLVQNITTTANNNLNGNTNPMFENWADGDFRLQVNSPAINAGNDQLYWDVVNGGGFDLAGNPRIHGSAIDLGAYERTGNCLFETTWNGTTWSNGTPDSTKKAIIEGDLVVSSHLNACELLLNSGTLTVTSGISLTVNGSVVNTQSADNFIVQSGGNLIQVDDVENVGEITVLKSKIMKHLDYTIWSSPVLGQKLKSFSPHTLNNRIRIYDAVDNSWKVIPNANTTDFASGAGYMFRAPNADNNPGTPYLWTGNFIGVAQNGEVTYNFDNAYGVGTYQSIGNPYPSNIDSNAFFAENDDIGTLYFWTNTNAYDGNDYIGYNWATINRTGDAVEAANGAIIPNGIIPVGQGFVAETNGNIGEATFNNSMRTSNNGVFFRTMTQEKHRIWLDLSKENQSINQMLISYADGATQGLDFGVDSKLFNYSGSALYSLIDNSQEQFVIQGRSLPFDDTDVVPLGFRANTAGSYSISLSNFDGLFAEHQDIFLKDNFTNSIHNLKDESYNFVSEEGTFNNRFELVYRNGSMSIANPELTQNWVVFQVDNSIQIQTQGFEMNEVVVYDMLGRIVYNSKAEGTQHSISTLNTNQVLIVKVITTENQILSKKVAN